MPESIADQAARLAKDAAKNELSVRADSESKSGTVGISREKGRLTLGVYVKAVLTGKKVSAVGGFEGKWKF